MLWRIWITQKIKIIDLNTEKLKTFPVDLRKLSDEVSKEVVKKTK